jgi:hypothetical protein
LIRLHIHSFRCGADSLLLKKRFYYLLLPM